MKKLLLSIVLLGALQLSTLGQTTRPTCKGIKTNGERCKSPVIDSLGYCYFHSPNTIHCQGVKKDGTKCRMIAIKGEYYCRYHMNQKEQ